MWELREFAIFMLAPATTEPDESVTMPRIAVFWRHARGHNTARTGVSKI